MAKQPKKRTRKDKTTIPISNPLKLTLPARPRASDMATTSKFAVEAEEQPNLEPASPAPLVPAPALPVSQPADPAIPISQPLAVPSPPALQPTPIIPAGLTPALDLHDDEMDQDIEIIAGATKPIQYPESSPGSKLLEDFFTLDDSQDESEISILPPTQKQKQTKKSQEKANLEEKAQRM
jgi:hypothetical protein